MLPILVLIPPSLPFRKSGVPWELDWKMRLKHRSLETPPTRATKRRVVRAYPSQQCIAFFLPLLHVVLTELFSLALHAACRRLELHWADPSQTRWYSNHRRRRYFGLDDEVAPSPGLSCVGTQTILQSRLAFDHGHEARPKMVKIKRPNSSHQLTHHTLHATYLGSVAVCQEFVDIVQEHEIFLMNLL